MDLARLTDLSNPSVFVEPSAVDRAAIYADAVMMVLLDGGLAAVSMGAVARQIGQAPSAVKQYAGNAENFVVMVIDRFAQRWRSWAFVSPRSSRLPVRLPMTDEEVHGVRVWAALTEWAAGEARAGREQAAHVLEHLRVVDRIRIAAALRRRKPEVSPADVTVVECFARGVQAAMTDPKGPLSIAEAEEASAALADALGIPVTTGPSFI